MVIFAVDMLTCMIVVLVAVIALDASTLYTGDLWSPVIVDWLPGKIIGVAPRIRVDVLVDVDAIFRAAATTALESRNMLVVSAEALLFGWKACSC